MIHKTPIQIRFKDLDRLGHVNNANHLTYFELARVHYFNDVIGNNIDWDNEGILIARATIDYHRPILLTDNVYVQTQVARFGTKSFDIEASIVINNGTEDIIAAKGLIVLVCYNSVKQTSIPVPLKWKEKVEAYQTNNQI